MPGTELDIRGFELHMRRRGLSMSTISQACNLLGVVGNSIRAFNSDNINELIIKLLDDGKSHAAVNKYLYAIKSYGRYVGADFVEGLSKLREDIKYQPRLDLKETEAFMNVPLIPPQEYETWRKYDMFWKTLVWTGMRTKEARMLSWDDIQDNYIVIAPGKTRRGRVVPIAPALKESLDCYRSEVDDDLLFPSFRDRSKPISRSVYRKDFHRRIKYLGIKKNVKPYRFRNSWVDRNATENNLLYVQDILGHADPKTTKRYLKMNVDKLNQIIESDPLGIDKLPPEKKLDKFIQYVENHPVMKDHCFNKTIKTGASQFLLELSG